MTINLTSEQLRNAINYFDSFDPMDEQSVEDYLLQEECEQVEEQVIYFDN